MLQFHIQLGKRRDGGFGVRTLPIYAVTDWRATSVDDCQLILRPSLQTVWRRLAVTLAAAVFLLLLIWSQGLPWQSEPLTPPAPLPQPEIDAAARELQAELERTLPPEQRQRFADNLTRAEHERARRLAEQRIRLDWRRRVGRAVYWALFEGLVTLGVLPLILAAWERIDLRNGPDDELIVRRRRFLTRERTWPRGSFGGILCSAAERIQRAHGSRQYYMGWFWIVRLLPRHEEGGIAPLRHVDDPVVEFHVAQQPDRPLDERRPPKRVRAFLKHICRMTNIEVRDVQFGIVPDTGASATSRMRRPVESQVITYTSKPSVETTTYASVDEAPAEIREQVRRLMKRGIPPEGISHESVRITIRDSDGNEQTYTSVDDLPADIRQHYEAARRKRRRE